MPQCQRGWFSGFLKLTGEALKSLNYWFRGRQIGGGCIAGLILARSWDSKDCVNEADWKTFRKMVPELRERYLEKKNQEVLTALMQPGKTPTERFWDAFERMQREARILERCLDGHSRSKMFLFMADMLAVGMLTRGDLENFSDGLQNDLSRLPALRSEKAE